MTMDDESRDISRLSRFVYQDVSEIEIIAHGDESEVGPTKDVLFDSPARSGEVPRDAAED